MQKRPQVFRSYLKEVKAGIQEIFFFFCTFVCKSNYSRSQQMGVTWSFHGWWCARGFSGTVTSICGGVIRKFTLTCNFGNFVLLTSNGSLGEKDGRR